jgi:nitrogen regulatory protein PII
MFVLDNPDRIDSVLEAWETVGITGVTILKSSGFYRRRTTRKIIPTRYQINPLIENDKGHYTLIAIVKSKIIVENCLRETEKLIGDLNLPDTGVFSSWPLDLVKGVPINNND